MKMRWNVQKTAVWRIGITPQVEVEINDENVEDLSSISCFRRCSSKHGGPEDNVKMSAGEGLQTFGALKRILNVRSVSLGVKRELYEDW